MFVQKAGLIWQDGPAQLDLVVEFYGHSIALAFYLASSMQEAADDMYALGGRPVPAVMHTRFLGWLSLARRSRPVDRRHRPPRG
ncbi:hypothetical protein [Micromonospora chokoriensis]